MTTRVKQWAANAFILLFCDGALEEEEEGRRRVLLSALYAALCVLRFSRRKISCLRAAVTMHRSVAGGGRRKKSGRRHARRVPSQLRHPRRDDTAPSPCVPSQRALCDRRRSKRVQPQRAHERSAPLFCGEEGYGAARPYRAHNAWHFGTYAEKRRGGR